ncbi:molybdopterin-dependent oxidoreductase [Desulfolithobacter sp.]
MNGNRVLHKQKTSLTRREVLASSFATGATLMVPPRAGAGTQEKKPWLNPRTLQHGTSDDTRTIFSVCLSCNGRCGVRATVQDGVLREIAGNPYHPYNHMGEPVPYPTPVDQALEKPSPVCGKAHDCIGSVYDPYRILRPLKRAGSRGEGKFEPIEWEQLIQEICEGGQLFAHLGENRHVPGLAELDSDEPIDPRAPELGPVRNGFVFMTGRLQTGRKALINRFVKDAMGSINRVGHTDICGIGFRMGNFALSEKKQWELKANPWEAKYILVFGANIYEALQPGINTYGAAIARRHSQGQVRFVIVDPRAQNSSVHADDWLPVKPGQDGALAMGMLRWMIDNGTYKRSYLQATCPAAAEKLGHGCYTNATHLVIVRPGHERDQTFLRQGDLAPSDNSRTDERYLVLDPADSTPVPFDTLDQAMLDQERYLTLADGELVLVKTAFRLMREAVQAHTLEEYASFCGIPAAKIARTARDFAAHGEKAAVCQYHGAGNYLCGTYAAYAIALLNVMTGSIEMRSGYLSSGGKAAPWHKGIYDLKDFPGRRKPRGVMLSREKAVYEKSSEFRRRTAHSGNGYPASRPWFAFTRGGLSVETMNGIDAGYPYRCRVLFHYFYNPVYSTPGGSRYEETLADPDRVPLYVSIDTTINESNIFADYIIPDVTWAEGHYGWIHPHAPACRFTALRTPLIEPLTGKTADGHPFCLETFLIDLASHLGLPGFGARAIGDREGNLHPLFRGEDFYLRGFANIAANAGLPAAAPKEQRFVETNYPVAKYRDILPDSQWRTLCYALARGGIFASYQEQFDGQKFKHGLKRVVLFNEEMAAARNALTGERYPGTVHYWPPTDSAGEVMADKDRDYPFQVVTHKMNVHTQSRTINHPAALEIFPENHIVMHSDDARNLGIQDGDKIRLVSRSAPRGITGQVQTTRLIRSGCLAISFHYGHVYHGASRVEVRDGQSVFLGGSKVVSGNSLIPDPSRGRGINPNEISRRDEHLGNLPMIDIQAGIPDFSSTRVRVLPA